MSDVWTDEGIREAFIYDGGESEYHDPINGAREQRRIMGGIFDAWLAEHDAKVRAEALREAAEVTRGEAPGEPHAGATFIAHAEWLDERADTGCPHEAYEIDTAGNPTRCADCGDYLDSVPDREPSDADFNGAAQTFYEASGLNLPHTSKPEVVAGVRAAWAALLAARNYREGN